MREQLKKWMPNSLKNWYRTLRKIGINACFSFFWMYPIKNRRVVICNVWGYGDNSKYIAKELLRRKSGCELIFITKNPNAKNLPSGIKFLKSNSFKAIKALATAKVWVDCNRKEPYIRKRKGQYYIQAWHGGLALKKIEGDYASHLNLEYLQNAKRDSRITDLYLSNGKICTNMYRRAFWYQNEILECGSPRLDEFLKLENNRSYETISKKRHWRTSYEIPFDQKIAVFAPTYRENNRTAGLYSPTSAEDPNIAICKLDYGKMQNVLETRFGGNWTIVLRLHPLVAPLSNQIRNGDKFGTIPSGALADASQMDDLYEILLDADILITDYSNTMFEFSMMNRPVFLFAPDQASYQRERGFYFKYEQLPYPISDSEEALFKAIEQYEDKLYRSGIQEFIKKSGILESGDAAKQVADRIHLICGLL